MSPLECSTIDTHTAGMPTRVVTDGLSIPGDDHQTVRERRDRFAEDHDAVREFLVCEPRGHQDMFAAVPLTPSDPTADLGLFFMDSGGYLDMCGHATIGAVTALVETGELDWVDEIVVETPAGLVRTTPAGAGERVTSVTFENVPSAYCGTRHVTVPDAGTVAVELVAAGNVCAILDAATLDVSLADTPTPHIRSRALAVRDGVNAQGPITDPASGSELPVTLTQLTESHPNRTAVVFGAGAIDRSPCGTGTSARMTYLHHRGDLGVGEGFRHVGPTGDSFSGRVLAADDGLVRTAVTGSAHVTGRHTFIRHPGDELDAFTLE